MNFLGFLAIVTTVTGLIWLLQILLKGKDQIDINISVGRKAPSITNNLVTTSTKNNIGSTDSLSANSILGDVLQPIPLSGAIEKKDLIESSTQPTPVVDTVRGKDNSQQGVFSPPLTFEKKVDLVSQIDKQSSSEDAYIDTAFNDTKFVNLADESLLEEVSQGQLPSQIGQLTYSCFGGIAEQMPPGSFDKTQSQQHIEAMFEVLRESTQRIETQMIALNAVQRTLFSLATQQKEKATVATTDDHSQNVDSQQSESTEYSFSDDENLEESTFGGGLAAQLDSIYPEDESQSAQETEFISTSEAGMDMPEDAMQSYDLNEVSEPITEVRYPILNYLAGLNQTGELSYEVVAAIKRKAPTREVKHRVRQVLRAIDHYNFSSDANALLRITAVFRDLPRDLENYDPDVAMIGEKFGILEPSDEPVSNEDGD